MELIKKLRDATGSGIVDCKKALSENNNDIDASVKWLREKGILKAQKKQDRETNEGVVVISGDENKMSLIEINCETDFVAKNDDFINFVKQISELNNNYSSNIDELKTVTMKNDKTVDENLVALIAKIGEKITIGRSKTLNYKNSRNFAYQHSVIKDNVSKLGVIVSLNTEENSDKVHLFGKQLSMHIAASNPIALNPNEIDKELIDKEVNLISEELKNSGKPEEIAKKISIGKINKFKDENSLMTQDWVMDPKMKVKEVIKDLEISNLNINGFIRLKIGE